MGEDELAQGEGFQLCEVDGSEVKLGEPAYGEIGVQGEMFEIMCSWL